MDMTGEQRIAASRQVVWAALNDVGVLKQCIPGCQSLEKISDTDMNARVTVKIGPVKAGFSGKVALSDLDPPNGYRISGQGSGGAAGFARGHAVVRLAEEGKATVLTYDVKADVGGKIAQLGARLIQSTAKKLADEFFDNFGKAVAPGSAVRAAATSAAAARPARKKGWFRRLFGRKDAAEASA
jgi:carbon monoxide dehydrogenase subunit G